MTSPQCNCVSTRFQATKEQEERLYRARMGVPPPKKEDSFTMRQNQRKLERRAEGKRDYEKFLVSIFL